MNENHDVLAERSSVVSCIGGYELWFRTTSLRFLGVLILIYKASRTCTPCMISTGSRRAAF